MATGTQTGGIIAAIASPAAPCARIVLRISGSSSHALVARLVADTHLPSRGALKTQMRISGLDVPALLLLFEARRSYTGEESAELHLPGNPLLAKTTLTRLLELGARPAEAGEFTARAFFNGQMDLTEAEGVAATIAAGNERELEAARRLQSGELTRRIRPLMDQLTQTLALLEAGIDFSEEEIRFITADQVRDSAREIAAGLRRLVSESSRFERLTHEPTIVLCGRPNAGKSTLLNALARRQRAIVSPIAGATRDLLSAEVALKRGVVHVIDTAGLELQIPQGEGAHAEIARQMASRAKEAIKSADVVVLLREPAAAGVHEAVELPRPPDLTVWSKVDDGRDLPDGLAISAKTGHGLDRLRERLDELAFGAAGAELLALNTRHVRQIELAAAELESLAASSEQGDDELVAEHLRFALDALGEISGIVTVEDVLGRIFSTFCIGK